MIVRQKKAIKPVFRYLNSPYGRFPIGGGASMLNGRQCAVTGLDTKRNMATVKFPGHPEVRINLGWLSETKPVKVTTKQYLPWSIIDNS